MADFYDVINTTIVNHLKYTPQVFPILKVELMDYLENTLTEITQDISKENAGSIEINYQQGVRRTCSITLINNLGSYIPSFNRGVWLHTKFKVYIGFDIGEDNYWYSQGIYILTNPSVLNERSNKTITLNGVDKFGVLGSETSFHELNGTYKIPAGTTVKNAIKDLLKMPIGNSGGNLIIYNTTAGVYKQHWRSAKAKGINGCILTELINNKYPSQIKTVTYNNNLLSVNAYSYDVGTYALNIPVVNKTSVSHNTDPLLIVAYEGYPLDPKIPIIDNRTMEYYDAVEFLGQDEVMWNSGKSYTLKYSDDTFIPIVAYSISQPLYKVYVNRQEIPYSTTEGVVPRYNYNPNTHGLWIDMGQAQLAATDTVSIIAKMQGSIGDIKLPYDIVKSPNEFYADLLIEIATVCACDIYYDVNGYLNFVKGNEKQEMDNLPTVWEFSDKSNYYFDATLDMDFTNMFNVIKVVGTNESAKDVCEKTVKNTQLNSPMCVQILGEKIKYVESSFCYNQPRTEDFANYLLRKYSRLQETLGFSSILLPFIDVNQVIQITDEYFELNCARFIIQSLSIPLTTDSLMQITSSNTANIPYFEAQGG